jgi:pre-rRNA-processing protein IPI3
MLSESFVASTLSSAKTPTATLRDVGICLQEFQPSPQLRSTFKKSSTTTNCLAVTPSHIFSAQADKAVVHVYSREKGNQEALVPFPERIRSIAVAGAKYGDVLVLGTEGGRLILWEVRQWPPVSSSRSIGRSIRVWSANMNNWTLDMYRTSSRYHSLSSPACHLYRCRPHLKFHSLRI